MATGPRYSLPYKRKRKNKTNYRKRLILLKGRVPRLVIRKTNTRIIAQIINFEIKGDKTMVGVTSNNLKKYGFNPSKNIPSSYLTGYLLGKLAIKNKIKKCVFDMGLSISNKESKLYAGLKGALDSGLDIPVGEKLLPSKKRINGEHIKGFDNTLVEKVKKTIDEKVK